MVGCENLSVLFGPSVLSGAKWTIPLEYQDLNFSGIIGSSTGQLDANGNIIINPDNLTGCILDCYIIDPNTGLQVVKWSSGGMSPAFTLTSTAVYPNPNYKLKVTNSALNILSPRGHIYFIG